MLYYPIDPNAEAGGGAGGSVEPGLLLGVAYIQRDADFVAPRFNLNKYLTNCSYKMTSGEVGSLESGTGRITLPEGCRFFKQSFHEPTPGLSGLRVVSIMKETTGNDQYGNFGQSNTNGVHGVSSVDVENDTWVEPVFIQLASSSFVFDASVAESKYIGMVEFFR